jgi:hypothetical protein
MSNERFVDLTERLLRAGIAARHARRAVQELREHYADVVQELRAAGMSPAEIEAQAAQRLGSDQDFVSHMLERPELRSWAYRRPFVAFTLLPILAFIIVFVLSVALLIAAFESAEHWRTTLPASTTAALRWVGGALFVHALWVAPVLVGAASCFVAARQRVPARWAISGAMVLGLLAASMTGHLEASPATSHGSVGFGFGIGISTAVPALVAIASRAGVLIAAMLLPYLWWLRHVAQGGGDEQRFRVHRDSP